MTKAFSLPTSSLTSSSGSSRSTPAEKGSRAAPSSRPTSWEVNGARRLRARTAKVLPATCSRNIGATFSTRSASEVYGTSTTSATA